MSVPKEEYRYTEFYLLGPDGVAGGYPNEVRVGQDVELMFGVISHEAEVTTYQVEVSVNGSRKNQIGPVALHAGEKWEKTVRIVEYSFN